jgi:hypothetical protein
VSELRSRLARLQPKADKAAEAEGETAEKEALMAEAKAIGEDYLQLEKYANLNYMVRTGCFFWARGGGGCQVPRPYERVHGVDWAH